MSLGEVRARVGPRSRQFSDGQPLVQRQLAARNGHAFACTHFTRGWCIQYWGIMRGTGPLVAEGYAFLGPPCIDDVLTEDIYLFMTENFLKYKTSFVASMSNFWWDSCRKKQFGAFIGKFMSNRYTFKNGLSLFVLNTTMKTVYKDALRSPNPTVSRRQDLLDFVHFEKLHTGENVGNWLHEIHKLVGCKPDFIGSHVVGGA